MVKRGERLDAGSPELINQVAVKIDAFEIGEPLPCGKMRGHEIEKRYAFTPMSFITRTSSL